MTTFLPCACWIFFVYTCFRGHTIVLVVKFNVPRWALLSCGFRIKNNRAMYVSGVSGIPVFENVLSVLLPRVLGNKWIGRCPETALCPAPSLIMNGSHVQPIVTSESSIYTVVFFVENEPETRLKCWLVGPRWLLDVPRADSDGWWSERGLGQCQPGEWPWCAGCRVREYINEVPIMEQKTWINWENNYELKLFLRLG